MTASLLLVPPSGGAILLRGRLSSYLEHKFPQQAALNAVMSAFPVSIIVISVIRPALSPSLIIALRKED